MSEDIKKYLTDFNLCDLSQHKLNIDRLDISSSFNNSKSSCFYIIKGGDGTYIKSINKIHNYLFSDKKDSYVSPTFFILIKDGKFGFHSSLKSSISFNIEDFKDKIHRYVSDGIDNNSNNNTNIHFESYSTFLVNSKYILDSELCVTSYSTLMAEVEIISNDDDNDGNNKNTVSKFANIGFSSLIVSTKYGSSGINYSYDGKLLYSDNKDYSSYLSINPLGVIKNPYYSYFKETLVDFECDSKSTNVINKEDNRSLFSNIKEVIITLKVKKEKSNTSTLDEIMFLHLDSFKLDPSLFIVEETDIEFKLQFKFNILSKYYIYKEDEILTSKLEELTSSSLEHK